MCGNSKCPLSDKCTTEVLEVTSCPAKANLKDALRMYFHFDTFRPGQLESLLPLAHGKDVFVHIPTGGGKSICMYLYPLALNDTAMGLVISPLIGMYVLSVKVM